MSETKKLPWYKRAWGAVKSAVTTASRWCAEHPVLTATITGAAIGGILGGTGLVAVWYTKGVATTLLGKLGSGLALGVVGALVGYAVAELPLKGFVLGVLEFVWRLGHLVFWVSILVSIVTMWLAPLVGALIAGWAGFGWGLVIAAAYYAVVMTIGWNMEKDQEEASARKPTGDVWEIEDIEA